MAMGEAWRGVVEMSIANPWWRSHPNDEGGVVFPDGIVLRTEESPRWTAISRQTQSRRMIYDDERNVWTSELF